MKRQDILSILITFTVGFVAGIYVYVTGFVPTIATISTPVAQSVDELVIVSEVYGGCGSSCPSYQVLENGSYRYLYAPAFDQEQVLQTGNIPFGLNRDLRQTLVESQLVNQSRQTTPALCESFSGGIDVRYSIALNGTEYLLDTCGTAVDTNSALWQNLERVWAYLESAGNSAR